MKSFMTQFASLVSLLVVILVLLGEAGRAGLITVDPSSTGWIPTLFRIVLTPASSTTLWFLLASLSAWVGCSIIERSTQSPSVSSSASSASSEFPPPGSLPKAPPVETMESPIPVPMPPQNRGTVAKEWNNLEEADKEAIRALVSQDGLWEKDIIALLEVRGFLHPKAALESLGIKTSFVKVGFDGHYSIRPEYQAEVDAILATDEAEDSLDSLKRTASVS